MYELLPPRLIVSVVFISFVDYFTRYCWLFALQNKLDILWVFPKFYAYVSTQFSYHIKQLQSDGDRDQDKYKDIEL